MDWQNAIVLAGVGLAAAYLARAAWRSLTARQGAACGSCSNCPASDGAAGAKSPGDLVQLGPASVEPRTTSAESK